MNPLVAILENRFYQKWDRDDQITVRALILEVGIPGLVDVQFTEEGSRLRVTPVFATEQDWLWYQLKYVNSL